MYQNQELAILAGPSNLAVTQPEIMWDAKFTQWTECKQITAIFVELEVHFPSFLLTRASY